MTALAPPTSPTATRRLPVRDAGVTDEDPVDLGPPVPDRRRRVVSAAFRMSAAHRPPPPDDRLIGVWAWATGLGIVGLAVALRGLTAITAGAGPSWYEPALVVVGLGGVGLVVAALLSAHRARLPWIMLGLASVPYAVNLALTLGVL